MQIDTRNEVGIQMKLNAQIKAKKKQFKINIKTKI
jgi:hypothetical protein